MGTYRISGVFQAQSRYTESSHKYDLLRISLERRMRELAPASSHLDVIREDLACSSPSAFAQRMQKASTRSSVSVKAAALTGRLEVR